MKAKVYYQIFLLVLMLLGCTDKKNEAHQHDAYTCPMHPTVVSDKPGSCPVCGMDLVRKSPEHAEVKITKDLQSLLQSPNQVIVSDAQTIQPQYSARDITVHVEGVVTYDTRFTYVIPSRIGGRLESVALKYSYQPVAKGQKVLEIYSPELVTLQRELLYLIETDPGNKSLIDATKQKLRIKGFSESQLQHLLSTKEPSYNFAVFSAHEGYVVPLEQAAPVFSSGSVINEGGMGGMTSSSNTIPEEPFSESSESIVKVGDYVKAGQSLFKIVSSKALRVELNLPISLAGSIRKGDAVHLDFDNMHTSMATVDFVQPFFNQGEEFLKVRVYTANMQDMHIGHLVEANIRLGTKEALWIPKRSVIDLGVDAVVLVKEGDAFRPKKVVMGISDEQSVAIVGGLTTSERIAANAQFLIDSESFVKVEK